MGGVAMFIEYIDQGWGILYCKACLEFLAEVKIHKFYYPGERDENGITLLTPFAKEIGISWAPSELKRQREAEQKAERERIRLEQEAAKKRQDEEDLLRS